MRGPAYVTAIRRVRCLSGKIPRETAWQHLEPQSPRYSLEEVFLNLTWLNYVKDSAD
jgi:hypothetical protein